MLIKHVVLQNNMFISRSKSDTKNNHYLLTTPNLSYFSGKIEMYLKYKEISYQKIELETILNGNVECEQLFQVNCVKSTKKNKRCLKNTSQIIKYLEKEYEMYQVIPKNEVHKFFHLLFENYADQYLWKYNIFMQREQSKGFKFRLIFQTILKFIKSPILSLREFVFYSHKENYNTKKKNIIANYYHNLLEILEEILSKQQYLFGNKPTLVDFAFGGSLNFLSDFTFIKIMQEKAPNVNEWISRLLNTKGSNFTNIPDDFPSDDVLPKNWNKLLNLLSDYFRYMQLNAYAYLDGKLCFDFKECEETFRVPVSHHRALCFINLQQEYKNYKFESKYKIKQILQSYKLQKHFFPLIDDNIDSEWNFELISFDLLINNNYTKSFLIGAIVGGFLYMYNKK